MDEYHGHIKRISLLVNERLLVKAGGILKAKTYSADELQASLPAARSQEVLEGLRPGVKAMLFALYSARYRCTIGGITVRSSVDCLAAIAIENRVPVWHRDRDFEAIARYTALEVFQRPN